MFIGFLRIVILIITTLRSKQFLFLFLGVPVDYFFPKVDILGAIWE